MAGDMKKIIVRTKALLILELCIIIGLVIGEGFLFGFGVLFGCSFVATLIVAIIAAVLLLKLMRNNCIKCQTATFAQGLPQVLVGSSFGGFIALSMVQQGVWAGPLVLLAPLTTLWCLPIPIVSLPDTYPFPVHIYHGTEDSVISIAHSRRFEARHPFVRLHPIQQEGHRLNEFAQEHLVQVVQNAWAEGERPPFFE